MSLAISLLAVAIPGHSSYHSVVSSFLDQVRELAKQNAILISAHGYDELAEDGLSAGELVDGLPQAVVVEEYPDYPKGPCVLVLQFDVSRKAVHVVWGIPKGETSPAVLVTAYRPDPSRWSADFMRRR